MEKYIRLVYLMLTAINLIGITQQQQQGFDPCENVDSGEYVRGPINCSHYIYCDDENPYDEYCDDGMYFNADTQECDDPENVQCDDENDEDEYYEDDEEYDDEYYDNEDEEEYNEDDEEDRDNNDDDKQAPNNCPNSDNPGKVLFIPSTKSCTEYYLCYHGSSILMQCSNSLHFNPSTNRCDFPRNVNCKIETPFVPTTHPRCDKDTVVEVYPHPTQCDYFYYCRKGHLSIQQCPFYFYFDTITRTCQFRDGFQCTKRYSLW